jgi:hypothetical protein
MDSNEFAEQYPKVEVPWGSHTINVWYRQNVYTPKWLNTRLGSESNALLADLIERWDLTRNGEPHPTDEDALGELPTGFLNTVLRAITDDQSPNQLKLVRSRTPS